MTWVIHILWLVSINCSRKSCGVSRWNFNFQSAQNFVVMSVFDLWLAIFQFRFHYFAFLCFFILFLLLNRHTPRFHRPGFCLMSYWNTTSLNYKFAAFHCILTIKSRETKTHASVYNENSNFTSRFFMAWLSFITWIKCEQKWIAQKGEFAPMNGLCGMRC